MLRLNSKELLRCLQAVTYSRTAEQARVRSVARGTTIPPLAAVVGNLWPFSPLNGITVV